VSGKLRPVGVDLFAARAEWPRVRAGGFRRRCGCRIRPGPLRLPYAFNFPDCAIVCRSVADIDAAHIRGASRIREADVDVAFGWRALPRFSLIGKRALDDARNSLVHHFVRLVVETSGEVLRVRETSAASR